MKRIHFVLFVTLFLSSTAIAKDSSHGAHPAPSDPSGWEAFSQLQNGNMRFYEGRQQHPNQDPARRDQLASGQKPHTIVLSCSDSRAAPETIFDQGLGDVFTVRLAGNVVTTEALASIEYAIEHLGAKLLLVLGHESCGAVGAAIASKHGVSNGSESLDSLVNQIRGNLSAASVASGATDKSFRSPVKENVIANMELLKSRSRIVREAVEKHNLVLAHGIYSLKTGRVEFWDVGGKSSAPSMLPDGPAIREQVVVDEPILGVKKVAKPPVKKPKSAAHDHH